MRVIVIEDVHWADEASLEFLLYLARRIGSRPIVLAMTYRGDEVGPSLERFLASLDRERLATEVALRRSERCGRRPAGRLLSARFKAMEGAPPATISKRMKAMAQVMKGMLTARRRSVKPKSLRLSHTIVSRGSASSPRARASSTAPNGRSNWS